MRTEVVVVGAGMAGLAASLAVSRALNGRVRPCLLEQATALSEVGAGLQLGPNAVRVLNDWGLLPALRACAAFPEVLQVRDAQSGAELGHLRLGERAQTRYGQPYATVHRADLHRLLLDAARAEGVDVQLGQTVRGLRVHPDAVTLDRGDAAGVGQAEVVLGCDGVWSQVRAACWADGGPTFTGDLAYRGLVPMRDLPLALRRQQVTTWLGRGMHAVQYPVRGGDWLNVVAIVEGAQPTAAAGWDHAAHATDLRLAAGPIHPDLAAVWQAVPHWRLWPLYARAPVAGPSGHARGRVALLGDAAHPMRPYLAQGAAMALEDAWALGRLLGADRGATDWPQVLQRWAQARWRRNAWVQARSRRNGTIFHAAGPLRWGRNLAMALGGEALLDVPALYAGPPDPLAANAGLG